MTTYWNRVGRQMGWKMRSRIFIRQSGSLLLISASLEFLALLDSLWLCKSREETNDTLEVKKLLWPAPSFFMNVPGGPFEKAILTNNFWNKCIWLLSESFCKQRVIITDPVMINYWSHCGSIFYNLCRLWMKIYLRLKSFSLKCFKFSRPFFIH